MRRMTITARRALKSPLGTFLNRLLSQTNGENDGEKLPSSWWHTQRIYVTFASHEDHTSEVVDRGRHFRRHHLRRGPNEGSGHLVVSGDGRPGGDLQPEDSIRRN